MRGEEPSHLRVVPPGQRSGELECLKIVSATLRVFVCLDVCAVLIWCLLVYLRSCWAISERPSAGTRLLGYLFCVGYVSAFCATGGGSRSGGVLVPLGTAVPWGDSPRVQGGPWAPPPCGDKSSETLLVLYLVFVRFLWDGCWVFCVVFFVSGVGLLSGFFALKDLTLVCPDVCGPLSLSLCLVCSSATFFSVFFFFSLSLSGAGGTQTPCGVWDSPCDSSSWTRTPTSTRTSSFSPSPRPRPAPVFFCFFSFVARLPARCFSRSLSWFWLVSPGVGLGRSVFFALACMH